jgi:hypothetical protein
MPSDQSPDDQLSDMERDALQWYRQQHESTRLAIRQWRETGDLGFLRPFFWAFVALFAHLVGELAQRLGETSIPD